MLRDIFFGLQTALLFLSVCAASDFCYRGLIPVVHTAVIIIACVMSFYSSSVFYSRTNKGNK